MQPTQALDYHAAVPRRGIGVPTAVAVVLLSVIAGFPGAILLHTYTCYFSAAIYLGHFPTPAHPDPGTLPSNVMFGEWLMPAGLGLTATVVIGLSLLAYHARRANPIVVAFGSSALLWILFIADPGGAVAWRLD